MVKLLSKTMGIMLIFALCVGINAQNFTPSVLKKVSSDDRAKSQVTEATFIAVTASFAPVYAPAKGNGTEILNESFTSGTLPTGWTTLDVDNDGRTWQFTIRQNDGEAGLCPPGPSEGRNDTYSINSASYYNCEGAFNPNNWLITPSLQLEGTTTLSFWVKVLDPTYNQDTYGIYVSTTGTNPSDFTQVYKETLNSTYTAWKQKTIEITQSGSCYIAFRHFDSYDKYVMCFDDIIIETGGVAPCPTITNLKAVVQGTDVILTWNAAENSPSGYKIYDGETELATITDLTYVATLSGGSHTLGVAAFYGEECVPQIVTTNVQIGNCNGVSNLSVNFAGDCSSATISWDPPSKNNRADMLWDNTNINTQNYGQISVWWTGGGNGRILADDFDAVAGWSIEQVTTQAFFQTTAPGPTTMGIKIFTDNNGPDTEVYSENTLSFTTSQNIYTINLPTPFEITTSGKYWISIFGVYNTPTPTTQAELNARHCFLLFGGNIIGEKLQAKDYANLFGGGTNWGQVAEGTGGGPVNSMYFTLNGSIVSLDTKYNVYRNGTKIAGPITETTFTDEGIIPGFQYEWTVATVCSGNLDSEWKSISPAPCGEVQQFTVNVSANPTAGGTALVNGSSTVTVDWGTDVTISNTPAETYKFINWTKGGDVFTANSTHTFAVTENLNLVANFAVKTYKVDVTPWPLEGGTVTGGGNNIEHGTSVTVKATANYNWVFEHWTYEVDGESVSEDAEYTFTVTADTDVFAIFKYVGAISKNPISQISIYPNPVKDVLTIVRSNSDKAEIEIYNTLGIMIQSIETNGTETEINVSKLASGVYMIKLINSKDGITTRFIKK